MILSSVTQKKFLPTQQEAALFLAVILKARDDGMADLDKYKGDQRTERERNKIDAIRWVRRSKWFDWYCKLIGFEPSCVRRKIHLDWEAGGV